MSATSESTSRSRRRAGCFWTTIALCGFLFLGGCLAFITFVAVGGRLTVSEDTTFITSPLKSDGSQVDYFAAWEQESYPDTIATDENGFRLVVQHLGPALESSPEHVAEVCRKLGLDAATLEPDTRLEEPYAFLEKYVASPDFDSASIDGLLGEKPSENDNDYGYEIEPIDVLESRYQRPWTLEDLPMMEAWLVDNSPAIDIISEAVRKPVFHIPHARTSEDQILIEILLPDVQNVRSFARALGARANYRIGTGDIDGAIDDIVACKRLGRHVGHNGVLIELLVGIAIEGIADSIGIAGSLEHPPSRGQLERFVKESNELPPAGRIDKAMLFDRYMTLDIVQAMSHGTNELSDVEVPAWALQAGCDWNVIAPRLNRYHDQVLTNGSVPAPKFRPMAVFSAKARSELVADTLGALLLPAVDAVREATWRRLCAQRMHRVSLAMLLYESDHGALPPAYTVDADGNPLHSWRVLVLPYLDQRTLYEKIRLDEPWDSQHNQKFHREVAAFYQCPSKAASPGQTTYSVVVGTEMPFEAADGKELSAFGPGSAAMILVVERAKPVCWMDPSQEIPQAVADAGINVPNGTGVASVHPGGANVGLRNCGCQFIAETVDKAHFEGLLRGTVEAVP